MTKKLKEQNPCNGLCLNSLHDKAFDKGLITLGEDLEVVISKEMKNVEMDKTTREWFYGYEGKQINLPDKFLPGKAFLEYHNDMIFMG